MSYAIQLFSILTIAFITLVWKINRAIAQEKKAQQAKPQNLYKNSWPTPSAPKKQKAEAMIVLLLISTGAAFGSVSAGFSASAYAGCAPLLVNFTNQSPANSSILWNFGNGNTSILNNPSATFLNPGSYTVTLIVYNGSQTDSVSKNIVVFTAPVANFDVSKTSACAGDTINFENMTTPGSAPVISYAWGFGNGIASSAENAAYQYHIPGIYGITLVVSDSNHCSANKTIPACIHVYALPTAAFSASPQNSCNASQLVQFNNTSTGGGLNYLWTLDTGLTSTIANPAYIYSNQIFNVNLVVTDSNGCKSAASKVITVQELKASFTASKYTVCLGQPVQFTNTSNFGGTQWYWNFGDGTSSTANNPAKTYTQTGVYTISFALKEDSSCADSVTRVNYIRVVDGFSVDSPSFTADVTMGCTAPFKVNFTNTTIGSNQNNYAYCWYFGNGDSSHSENPTETYTNAGSYNIYLEVTDSGGCKIALNAANYIVCGPPVPKAVSDTLACLGSPVRFSNYSLYADSFLWRFGDGDSSTIANTTHAYAHNGNYRVSLTAYSHAGCDSTLILPNPVHIAPLVSDFIVRDSFSRCPPFVALFSNLTPRAGNSFLWIFGDGTTDTAYNPTHIFFYPGVYTVKLVTIDNRGFCTDTLSRINAITVQGPNGNFAVNPLSGCVPLTASFSAVVSANTQNFWCDLGDGYVVSDTANFTHIYSQPRVYHPKFILTDYVGCRISYFSDSIITYPAPIVNSLDTTVCAGTPLGFSASDESGKYSWSPPAFLNCDTCANVVIKAPISALYTVTATNAFGCQSTGTVSITAMSAPVLTDSVAVTLCQHDTTRLFVGDADSILWWPAQYLSSATVASPLCTPQSTTVYTVIAKNANGCVAQSEVTVTIKNKMNLSVNDSIFTCAGIPVELETNLAGNYQGEVEYSWSPGQYLNNPVIATPMATVNDSATQFQVIVSNGHCAADTALVTVYTSSANMQVPTAITTIPFADVVLTATSAQTLSYSWWATDEVNCNTCASCSLQPAETQMVYVQGKSTNGCIVEDSVAIIITSGTEVKLFIPNVFTPNGDGNNDYFQVYGNMQDVGFFEIRIFNRWGEQVFASDLFDFKWDGTYKGVLQPPGAYIYEIQMTTLDGKPEKVRSGSITLLR